MDSGINLGDLIPLMTNRNDNDGWGGSWMWVIFLFFIFAIFFAGDGFFGRGKRDDAVSKADLCEAMNFNQVENSTRGLASGICDSTYALNTTGLNTRYELGAQMCQGFNTVGSQLAENRFAQQQCCCETNRNIDAVRYENAKNTCDIITAGQANTQRIIDFMTQEKIDSLRTELQAAQLQLSNNAQTQTLIDQLRPCAKPTYLTCSPYTTLGYPYGYNTNNCGCGCGA